MSLTRKQMVSQLKEAAKLLEVLGNDPQRAKAYHHAARQLESFEGDFERLMREDRLNTIRGIGKTLATELKALETQERLPVLEQLYKDVPEGVRGLFRVSGLGAKKIATLWQGGVTNLEALLAAGKSGSLADMRGFGQKSAEAILAAAEFAQVSTERLRLDTALAYAQVLTEGLQTALPHATFSHAGSLRRNLETIGDLDLVVTGAELGEVVEAVNRFADFRQEGAQLRFTLDGKPVEILVADTDAYPAALALWTGNSDYRETLLARAQERGMELREDGLFREGERISLESEHALFEQLELPFIPPERRESAHPAPIEDLVTLEAIHGAVHNHSTYSDGANSLREMVQAAKEQGYTYLAMADHSRSSYYANGLSIERVAEQAAEIAEIRRELEVEGSPFKVLHGIEVDILPDGSLDYPDEVLAQLDYTVVSVHQQFQLDEKQQTERIVRAVQSPYASILAHATGRLLLQRPSYALDVQAVIEACAATSTVIELNANPRRLDLDWRWVIKAKELGCTFAVNPDAHHAEGYGVLHYGVLMARKAGLTVADVINTAPDAERFLARLQALKPKAVPGVPDRVG